MEYQTIRLYYADYIHRQWSRWMTYMFNRCTRNDDGTITIPAWAVTRWQRQIATSLADLPSDEQESDLREADKLLTAMIRFDWE